MPNNYDKWQVYNSNLLKSVVSMDIGKYGDMD